MRSIFFRFSIPLVLAALSGCSGGGASGGGDGMRVISLDELRHKIRGGWAGQMIGVSFGAPTEFRALGQIIEGEIPWSPERVAIAIRQDDLYVEMTFAEVMDRLGLEATTEQYGDFFRDTKYNLWHANAGARRNLNRGIKAPMSGHPQYNQHANDIDFQIEADFIGMMCPGMPAESNKYCDRVGRVMNHGDGLYGGMFVCGMYAAAFFEKDPRKVVEAGLACMPAGSEYANVIRDTLELSGKYPEDWKRTWRELNAKWDRNDACPEGSVGAFNIDASLNGAYIAIGMLYGKGDFTQTLQISTRCGQDSDCNPSNAAGIIGVMFGYDAIPAEWKSGIESPAPPEIVRALSQQGYDSAKWSEGNPKIEDIKFDYTNFSMNEIVESTLKRAIKVAESAGGRVEGDKLYIPRQKPVQPELEQWSMGMPTSFARLGETGWKLTGDWVTPQGHAGSQPAGRIATTAGLEAELSFDGSAIALLGHHRTDGGRADVYVDGEKKGMIDAFTVPNTTDLNLWHTYGLAPGPHTVKIVTREDRHEKATTNTIHIIGAVTYVPEG